MLPNEEKGEGAISIGFSTKMADSRSRHQELVERSSPKHLQPKEGRKEPAPAPRAIKLWKSRPGGRDETAIRERSGEKRREPWPVPKSAGAQE